MIVLMASTCLQNDCQKQPCQGSVQASDFTSNHQTEREKKKDRDIGRQLVRKELKNCFYAFLICSLCSSGHAIVRHLSLSYASFISTPIPTPFSTAISTPTTASLSHLAIVCMPWQKVTQSCNQSQSQLQLQLFSPLLFLVVLGSTWRCLNCTCSQPNDSTIIGLTWLSVDPSGDLANRSNQDWDCDCDFNCRPLSCWLIWCSSADSQRLLCATCNLPLNTICLAL